MKLLPFLIEEQRVLEVELLLGEQREVHPQAHREQVEQRGLPGGVLPQQDIEPIVEAEGAARSDVAKFVDPELPQPEAWKVAHCLTISALHREGKRPRDLHGVGTAGAELHLSAA